MTRDEKANLKTMLNYWIEHNREHGEEFREWAEKAKVFREARVAEDLLAAAREMDKVNELLSGALSRLK